MFTIILCLCGPFIHFKQFECSFMACLLPQEKLMLKYPIQLEVIISRDSTLKLQQAFILKKSKMMGSNEPLLHKLLEMYTYFIVTSWNASRSTQPQKERLVVSQTRLRIHKCCGSIPYSFLVYVAINTCHILTIS